MRSLTHPTSATQLNLCNRQRWQARLRTHTTALLHSWLSPSLYLRLVRQNMLQRQQQQLQRFQSQSADKVKQASKLKRRKRAPNFKKKVKASKRWKKASKKVSRIQRQVSNQRQDWIHKVATQLVSGNSLIATEELNLKGMTRKGKKGSKRKAQKTGLNRSMLDVGIAALTKAIEYKLQEAGGFLVYVPTKIVKPSQTCPNCGHQRKKDLSERVHHCSECGATYDRDVAAAMVMLSWALGICVLKRGEEIPTSDHCHTGGWKQISSLKRHKPRT